jgi:heme-degrading monooxygenase HmoA
MSGYSYVWEFEVRADRQAEFEAAYGPDGAWVALFREAAGYVGTLLLHDRERPLRYVTVDRWQSRREYLDFRARFAGRYAALDRQCEGLTTREQALGEYNESTPAR